MPWTRHSVGKRSRIARRLARSAWRSWRFESLESRRLLAGDLEISEFVASNSNGLEDQDGDASDWVELHNRSTESIHLGGWHLTDDADDLARWTFPDIVIPAQGYLVVFASGKDRATPESELHTNFRLDAAGEFLALVQPDGVTLKSRFEPTFPRQSQDVSFGLAQAVAEPVTLLDSASAATALIPTEEFHNAVGDAWRDVDFDTSDWLAGPAALGFEKSVGYEDLIDLDVGDAMYGVNQSIYARIPFQVSDPGQLLALSLHMRYDDGFAAYLNGTLVATRNGPANLTWNSGATAQHPDLDAREFEAIDISQYLSALRGGDNVLALHGLNAGVASNDFLLSPKLTAIEQSAAAELDYRYMTTPTPGATNVSDAFVELVADPTFSSASGVFGDATNILLRGATPGASVIYTLDGTIPSPTNGHWVTADSEQSVAETTLTVSMTSSIRAISVKDGLLSSSVATASYVILSAVATQPANPVGFNMSWAGYQADYGMDPDVINTTLPDYDLRTALLSLPSLVVATRIEDLFGASGIYANSSARGQERHASVELVDPNGGEGFQIDAGLQMHGNSSRDHGFTPKHPMRVLFKSEYGARKLRHQVFPDSTVTRFDELLLRGASTDSWPVVDGNSVMGVQRWAARHATYIRDQYMRDTQLALGHASGHGIYVHLYLDGLYWGVYNLAERPGDSFNAETFGGEKEEYDVIKDFAEVESGNATAWNQLMGLANAGLASEAAYQYIQGNHPDGTRNPAIARLLDVENLIDYMILHIYSGAEDWPHHNWWAARRRGPESEGFRFFVWDQEISNDSLVRMYTLFQTRFEDPVDSPSPSYLYGRLLANASFRLKFADRVQQLCFNRGVLSPEANYDRWMVRQQQLDHAIVAESARWGDARRTVPYKREVEWLAEMDFMREVYWPGVQAVALERFRRKGLFPEILAPELLVDGEPTSGGRVPSGAQLELLDANETPGTIYYTLDGVDPRMPISALETYVLATGAEPARYRVPEDATNDGAWFQPGFDDSAWGEGFAAIGFERTSGYEDEFRTDVGLEMFNIRQSVFLRVPFDVAALPEFDTFTLRMKYDDGFVAYLNGVPIASRNAPDAPRWDSGATTQHADLQALQFEDVDITPFAHLLQEGQNILAIQGLNAGVGSSDFLIVPEIVAVNTSGDLSPSALPYTGSLTLTADTLIRTRVKRSGEWSTLIEAAFTIPSALRISELMFHPPDASPGSLFAADDFEFVELINSGETPLTISGYRFTQGIEFTFADDLPALGPGERMLVVKNRTAFATRYGQGWNIAGEYEGQLSNGGERLQLVDAGEEVVLNFVFDDGWEPNADGGGRSLVIRDVKLAPETWSDGGSWTSSRLALGSPGLPENRGLGDANGDGTVDLIDLNAVRNSFGGFGFGDTDDDRDVDLGDLNAVRNYFGAENTSPIANRMLEGAVDIMEVRHLSTRTSEDERTRSIDELAHFLIVHERIRELPPSAAIRRNSIGMIAYCTRHFSSQST